VARNLKSGALKWSLPFEFEESDSFGSLVACGDDAVAVEVIQSGRSRIVYIRNGSERWSLPLDSRSELSDYAISGRATQLALPHKGLLLVTTGEQPDLKTLVLDIESGELIREQTPGGYSVQIDGGTALVVQHDDRVSGIDIESGKEQWEYEAGPVVHGLMISGSLVYVIRKDGTTVEFDSATGSEREVATVEGEVLGAGLGENLLFVSEHPDGLYGLSLEPNSSVRTRAIDLESGEVKQEWNRKEYVAFAGPDDTALLFERQYALVDGSTGEELWRIGGGQTVPPMVASDGSLIMVELYDSIYVVE
jgi:outer membrane protein assembly factor BamB